MADDENGRAEGPLGPSLDQPGSESKEISHSKSEWTASDARGPLNAADENGIKHPDAQAAPPVGSEFERGAPHESAVRDGDVHDALAPEQAAAVGKEPESSIPVAEKRSAWPIAAGIVVGAVIGAGSAWAYYASQSGASSSTDQQIAALSRRLDELQTRPDPQAAIASLKSSVGAVDGRVAALQKAVDADARADKTQAAKTEAAKTEAAKPTFDPAPLTQKIQALQTSVDALRKQADADKADDADDDKKVAAIAAEVVALKALDGDQGRALADLKTQSSSAQAGVEQLRASQKTLEAKLSNSPALAVVADSLVAQIDHGGPYTAQVDALSAIGADPARIAVLKENADKGVPSAKALATGFEPLADPIVASEHRASASNASFLEKMKSGMFSMVSVRAVGDTGGDSLASRVSAIASDLAHDDVAAAYRVWTTLPAEAKAKSDAWGAQAKTHAEAMAAARALQTQAIAGLGAKKS